MDLLSFITTIILVTASGALAPGPLFFATISHGARSGAKSGLIFSVAHTIVEFTLVMLLATGLLTITSQPLIKAGIGVAGGLVLIFFGIMQIRGALSSEFGKTNSSNEFNRNQFLIGLAFTGLNPFFIIWWLTVGANLIILALEFASYIGVIFMYVCHVWIDFAWLILIAHLAKMGTKVAGLKWYKVLMISFSIILIYYGFSFLLSSLSP